MGNQSKRELINQARLTEAEQAGAQGELRAVVYKRPDKLVWWFSHPNPAWEYPCAVLECGEQGTFDKVPYLVADRAVLEQLQDGDVIRRVLVPVITEAGIIHLWPISAGDNAWATSARDAVRASREQDCCAVRVTSNRTQGAYATILDHTGRRSPPWPTSYNSVEELVETAFPEDRIITSTTHPKVLELSGQPVAGG